MHAATRKRRLVNRLIRKVNKLTAEAQYWRKRAKKLASGAIEVEDDTLPTNKSVWQNPPDTMRRNLLVCMINNISGGKAVSGSTQRVTYPNFNRRCQPCPKMYYFI